MSYLDFLGLDEIIKPPASIRLIDEMWFDFYQHLTSNSHKDMCDSELHADFF